MPISRHGAIRSILEQIDKVFKNVGVSYWWAILLFCLFVCILNRKNIRDLKKQDINNTIGTIGLLFGTTVAFVLALLDQMGVLRCKF